VEIKLTVSFPGEDGSSVGDESHHCGSTAFVSVPYISRNRMVPS